MITVKDIREKDFSLQKRGYSEDEVDDFLDAIADQLGSLIRENRDYLSRAEQAEQQRDEAIKKAAELEKAASKIPAPIPAPAVETKPQEKPVDESAYFDNLKTALREALLSAQRIADETVTEAKNKAADIVKQADDYAKKVKDGAVLDTETVKKNLETEVAGMKDQLQTLKSDHQTYKAKFVNMLKTQLKALGDGEDEKPEDNGENKEE